VTPSSDELYGKVFEASPDGILVVGASGRIVDLNPTVERLFGYARDELLGQAVESLVPEAAREAHVSHRRRYHSDPHPRPMGVGMELRGRRKDGTVFPVEISLSNFSASEETFVIATVRDISDRKRLRDFGAGALRAAEDERERIARELHDETAQRIATLLIQLRVWERRGIEEAAADRFEHVRKELKHCAEGVRRIARGLRPPELEDAGLVAAIRSHLRTLAEAGETKVSFDAEPVDGLLAPDVRLVVYRVVQEAVSNAIRHANGSRIAVTVGERRGDVYAEVEDDGRGFDPRFARGQGHQGLGLLGMRERATMVGGSLLVESDPGGGGTRIRLRVPGVDRDGTRAKGSGAAVRAENGGRPKVDERADG